MFLYKVAEAGDGETSTTANGGKWLFPSPRDLGLSSSKMDFAQRKRGFVQKGKTVARDEDEKYLWGAAGYGF